MGKIKEYKFYDKRVYVVGDIHGNFKIIKNRIKEGDISNSVIIFAGDVGIGFEKKGYYKQEFTKLNKFLKTVDVTLLFVYGNHDDSTYFNEELINHSNIKTLPDYSVVSIHQDWDSDMIEPPKYSILCVGGGISIDREYRKNAEKLYLRQYLKWHPHATREDLEKNRKQYYWENEAPVYHADKLDDITNAGYNIEYVVTHTAPNFCYPYNKRGIEEWLRYDPKLEEDINNERKVMTNIYNYLIEHKHVLKGWYYGHFHSHHSEYYENVNFTLLDCEHHKWDMVEIGYRPMEITV